MNTMRTNHGLINGNGANSTSKILSSSIVEQNYKISHHHEFGDEASLMQHWVIKQALNNARSAPVDHQLIKTQRFDNPIETKKRKAVDNGLDLNLSLRMKVRSHEGEYEDEEVDSSLSLSLFPSSPKKEKKFRDPHGSTRFSWLGNTECAKKPRLASTLDLTI